MTLIRIYCDDNHTRWDVTEMTKSERWQGRWTQNTNFTIWRRRAGVTSLAEDQPVTMQGFATGREYMRRDKSEERESYVFVCRKCKRHPLSVTHEKLAEALDLIADSGVSEVTLRGIGAILQEMTRR